MARSYSVKAQWRHLTEVLMQQLRVFHAQSVRAMCRVTRKHTWEHHISSEQLRERLGLDSIV